MGGLFTFRHVYCERKTEIKGSSGGICGVEIENKNNPVSQDFFFPGIVSFVTLYLTLCLLRLSVCQRVDAQCLSTAHTHTQTYRQWKTASVSIVNTHTAGKSMAWKTNCHFKSQHLYIQSFALFLTLTWELSEV